jgi:hypothetical protein
LAEVVFTGGRFEISTTVMPGKYMYNVLGAVAVIIVTGLASCTSEPVILTGNTTSQKRPMLAVSEDVHDFGKVGGDRILNHTFILKNIGGDTLRITNIQTSTGADVAWVNTYSMAATDTVHLHYRADFRHGPIGRIMKNITLHSNDSSSPVKTIFVKLENER